MWNVATEKKSVWSRLEADCDIDEFIFGEGNDTNESYDDSQR